MGSGTLDASKTEYFDALVQVGSSRNRYPVSVANSGTGDNNLSPLIEAFFKGVDESLACFRSNFVVEDPSDKNLPQMRLMIEDVV